MRILKKLTRIASNILNIVPSVIRNMHIPAYCPELCGVKFFDQRGVEVETKKIMAIESAPIVIEDAVEGDEGMVIISVAVADIAMVIDMSIPGSGGACQSVGKGDWACS
jgi:hypothetical protein